MIQIICLILSAALFVNADECKPSITTASGPDAPQQICSGRLIYHEPFDDVNKTKWVPQVTFSDFGVRIESLFVEKSSTNSIFTNFTFFTYRTTNSNGM